MLDPVRLLHKHSEQGYTEVPALALPGEPEAIPRQAQERQSSEGLARDREHAKACWMPYRHQLLALLDNANEHPWSATFRGDLRSARSYVERIDKRLA